jgi:hypothetical protein
MESLEGDQQPPVSEEQGCEKKQTLKSMSKTQEERLVMIAICHASFALNFQLSR